MTTFQDNGVAGVLCGVYNRALLQEVLERGQGGGAQLITRVEKELEAVTDMVKDNISNLSLKRAAECRCLCFLVHKLVTSVSLPKRSGLVG